MFARDLILLPQPLRPGKPEQTIVSDGSGCRSGILFELTAHDTPHLIVTRGEHSYERLACSSSPGPLPLLPVF